jgi:hypothetical protein
VDDRCRDYSPAEWPAHFDLCGSSYRYLVGILLP